MARVVFLSLLPVLVLNILLTMVLTANTDTFSLPSSCPGKVMLPAYIEVRTEADDSLDCARQCSQKDSCKSFHYGDSWSKTCQLNSDVDSGDCSKMESNSQMAYFEKVQRIDNIYV